MHLWRFLKKKHVDPPVVALVSALPTLTRSPQKLWLESAGVPVAVAWRFLFRGGGGDEGGRRIQKSMDVYLFFRFFLEIRKIQNGMTGGNLESVVVIVVEDYWTEQ